MYTITANEKGSREIVVTKQHLDTLQRFSLLSDLIPSHGIITEHTLNKLRMNVRSLIEANPEEEDLINLCSELLYHKDMKAFGLHQLVTLFLHSTEAAEN